MAIQSDDAAAPGFILNLIEQRAQYQRENIFLVAARTNQTVTFGELAMCARHWGQRLSKLDLGPGARVGLLIADPLEFATTFVGLLANGIWVAPLDPALVDLQGHALDQRLSNLRLRAVVSDRERPHDAHWNWIGLDDPLVDEALSAGPRDFATNEGGVVLASSGTTGPPKVILLPTRQLLHASHLIARHNELDATSIGFNSLPLWHINAEVVAVLASLVAGSTIALDDRFHRTDFWVTIKRMGVTWINAVPAIIAHLSTLRDGETVPEQVRFIRSASAPLPATVLARFQATTGLTVIETYGMTEAASQICANPLAGPHKLGSVGRPVGVELRIRQTDSGAKAGIGEVEIRGPSVIERYESRELDVRFDEGGWLRTGDMGYLDDDGYLFLAGRRDDMINRGGEKIFPREIEDVVLGVPGVANAAVIARDDEVFGQVPVLYLQLHVSDVELEESAVVLGAVREAVSANFDRTRRPVEVVVVERMPTHATGKIQKKVLGGGSVSELSREAFA